MPQACFGIWENGTHRLEAQNLTPEPQQRDRGCTHEFSHYCCLLQHHPDSSIWQKKTPKKPTQTKPTLMILYCSHSLVFSTVSQELVKETWKPSIANHLLECSKCMLEAEDTFTNCFHLNIPAQTVLRGIVGKQTALLDGSSDMGWHERAPAAPP